jgi:aconitate hydratase 2/2-methylisocitrate dehydratase
MASKPEWPIKSTVMSTSTRNYPNRLGKNANVYLASGIVHSEAMRGKIPTREKEKGKYDAS